MRTMQSAYMHWAKFKPKVRFDLTGSEVPHFRMDSLSIQLPDLDLDGASHPRYAPLREEIARRYRVEPDQVVLADGTSMANFLTMATLISPGDEVVIEHPAYELLLSAASFLGAKIRRFERRFDDCFRLDPTLVEPQITDRTRLVIVTNLHNPSCALAAKDELLAIGELASKVGAHVLVDEVYLDCASPVQSSAVHLGANFAGTNSLTKSYGLSGLRCGWILADRSIAERMWRLNDLFGVNQAHPAERLACIAFQNIDKVIGNSPDLLARNREMWNGFVRSRSDLECMPAEQGATAFPRWSGGDSERLDQCLRERYDAAIVPGRWFELSNHFRIGFGTESSEFEEGLQRLGSALDDCR